MARINSSDISPLALGSAHSAEVPQIPAYRQEQHFVRHGGVLAEFVRTLEMTPFRVRVCGTGGCGKSLMASVFARDQVKQGRRVLMVCFTRLPADRLQSLLPEVYADLLRILRSASACPRRVVGFDLLWWPSTLGSDTVPRGLLKSYVPIFPPIIRRGHQAMCPQPIRLNHSQASALEAIEGFLASPCPIFLLKGGAGTGKTTLIERIAQSLYEHHRPFEIIAPTGRAARILHSKTRQDASTIHGLIYSQPRIEVIESAQSPNDPGMRLYFPTKQDDPENRVFIVDEASMVGDKESKGDLIKFGSGRLLSDLIGYARLGRQGRDGERGAKILFVGDPAQLPPVTETLSPAMSAHYLRDEFGLASETFELTEVMRQQAGSAVLDRATVLRDAISRHQYNTYDISDEGDEIRSCSTSDAVAMTVDRLRNNQSSVFITRTNAQALKLNRAIRGRLWGDEDTPLSRGDLLLINRNSYRCQLSNGDLIKIETLPGPPQRRTIPLKVTKQSQEVELSYESENVTIENGEAKVRLGFQPARIIYRGADLSVQRTDCILLENLLDSKDRELTPLEVRALLVDFRQRHPALRPKTDAFNIAIRQDPYFNALQVKYGYAMTCHKAQGGEWETAMVDFSGGGGTRNEEFFRWSYTAITRASTRLVTIDAPRFSPTSNIRWEYLVPGEGPDATRTASATITHDPDWERFNFNPGQEGLFRYHVALREACAEAGIAIERIDHLQYMQRYALSLGEKHAHIQYHYKGNQKVSKTAAVPGIFSDQDLLETALSMMETTLRLAQSSGAGDLAPFMTTFRDKLDNALRATDIRLVSVEPLQYRLRVVVEQAGHCAKIDFCYNNKQQWTSATEVGGLGTSRGMIDRVRRLIGDGA